MRKKESQARKPGYLPELLPTGRKRRCEGVFEAVAEGDVTLIFHYSH